MANIAELKEQLDEERTQRKEEREKAAADLKAAVNKAQSEAQEELKKLSDTSLRRERELQEAINKLQVWKFKCLIIKKLFSFCFKELTSCLLLYVVGVRERKVFTGRNLEAQAGMFPFLLLLARPKFFVLHIQIFLLFRLCCRRILGKS